MRTHKNDQNQCLCVSPSLFFLFLSKLIHGISKLHCYLFGFSLAPVRLKHAVGSRNVDIYPAVTDLKRIEVHAAVATSVLDTSIT
mgnify:CR=1 FL=1